LSIATIAPTTTTSSLRPILGTGSLVLAGLFLFGLSRSTFLGAIFLAAALATTAIGCGSSSNGGSGSGGNATTVPGTTPGAYVITITATSGALTTQSTINLQVQ
jgi:hypothetical protein